MVWLIRNQVIIMERKGLNRVKMREDRGLKNNKAVALVSDAAAGVSKFWGSGFVISHTI